MSDMKMQFVSILDFTSQPNHGGAALKHLRAACFSFGSLLRQLFFVYTSQVSSPDRRATRSTVRVLSALVFGIAEWMNTVVPGYTFQRTVFFPEMSDAVPTPVTYCYITC
ncbi:hypothetical protein DPSP01_012252 [Paraphaeosphaeria sporulosa]